MVYKKYIKRNGKVYGPYIYQSKRVGEKVVSESVSGLKKPKKYSNFLLVFGALVIVALMVFFFISSDKSVTGEATLNLNANYKTGEILKGKLDLNLKEGEFIPANSKVIFENNNEIYEFDLRDVLLEDSEEGEFYVEGKNIQGSGEGYGSKGVSKEYAEVYFELNIYKQESTEDNSGTTGGSGNSGGSSEETPVDEEITEEIPEEETEVVDEIVEEEIIEDEVIEEEVQEPIVEGEPVVEEESVVEGISETVPLDVVSETEEPVEEPFVEETPPEPEPIESSPEENVPAPITGNFIARITGAVTGSGDVALELEKTVEGKVKFGEEFVYNLGEGEIAELKPLSVKNSLGEELDDKEVKVKTQDSNVVVNTNYGASEEGYGEEFLGEDLVKLSIDLEDLGLEFEEGNLRVKIIYQDSEILALESPLTEGDIASEIIEEPIEEEPEENETEVNETLDLNDTLVNDTLELNESIVDETNKTISIMSVEPLSIPEKARLLGYFGNSPIEVTKSEIFNDRIIVGYKLGSYEIEFSYDSEISPELLEMVMENDRIIWLRDLSRTLGSEESSGEEFDLGNSTDNLTLKDV